MDAAVPIPDEPPRGASADASLLALPGEEQLRSFLDGRAAAPPVARLTGGRLAEVEQGRVAYTLPVSDWLVGPKGSLHPAVLAFLADAPLLAAVHSTLPSGTITTTAEVSMTFLGTALRGDELRAEGLVHADSGAGLSEVFVTRRDGRLIGHGTSRVFIFPPIPQDGPAGRDAGVGRARRLQRARDPRGAARGALPASADRPPDGDPARRRR